jgi:hypothetical protein
MMSKLANEHMSKSANLLHAATLGLNRQRIDWEQDDVWGEIAEQGNTAAEKLLHVLAARQLAAKAAYEAGFHDHKAVASAPKEELSYVDIAGAHILYQVIHTQSRRLLEEALQLLVKNQAILPSEYLPALMDVARDLEVEKNLLNQACGKRLLWLAALRDSWKVYLPVMAEEWKTGNSQQRLQWFLFQRKNHVVDSHSLWDEMAKSASSEELIAFTHALKEGLGEDDEAKLEPLLDHRRKEVRKTAFSQLTKIPDTALMKRMENRVQNCISQKGRKIEVKLPQLTKEWERDGFADFSYAASGLGKKAGHLCHLLSCVSLDYWTKEGNWKIEKWIKRTLESEWASAIFLAFCIAAIRQKQQTWAELLLQALFEQKELLDVVKPNVRVELIRLVNPEKREALFLKELKKHDRFEPPFIDFSLLIDHDENLPEALALAFYKKLRKTVVRRAERANQRFRYLLYELPNVALRTPISLYPQIAALFPIELLGDGAYRHYLEEMLTTLDFRYKMYKSFT